MTDDDWAALRPLYDEWLAGATEGAQATSLSALTRPLRHAADPT